MDKKTTGLSRNVIYSIILFVIYIAYKLTNIIKSSPFMGEVQFYMNAFGIFSLIAVVILLIFNENMNFKIILIPVSFLFLLEVYDLIILYTHPNNELRAVFAILSICTYIVRMVILLFFSFTLLGKTEFKKPLFVSAAIAALLFIIYIFHTGIIFRSISVFRIRSIAELAYYSAFCFLGLPFGKN